MIKRTQKMTVALMMALTLAMPTTVLADDIPADYTGNNSEVVETNNGHVEENTGTIASNEGTVDSNNSSDDFDTYDQVEGGIGNNKGEVDVNNGTIRNNTGHVGTNADGAYINFVNGTGSVDVNNSGTKDDHDEKGIGGLAGLDTSLTTNNGYVMSNMGTIVTNSETGYVDENGRNASYDQGGTIENNAGTVRSNNELCTIGNNTGTVEYNSGVVVNADGGVVKVNRGGEVKGSGTVNINLSNADKVESGVTVINQMWELISNVWGHLTPSASSYASEYSATGDIHKENEDSATRQLRVWLSTTGEVIVSPTDANRQIKSLAATNGGAMVERLENGTYKISNITKDVNLAVSFYGDPDPASVPNKETDSEHKEDGTPSTQTSVDAATAAQLTGVTAVLDASMKRVAAIAPVITQGALYGAVDAYGNIIPADISQNESGKMNKERESFLQNALTMTGISLEGKEAIASFSGKMTNVSAGSVVTMRAYTKPEKGDIMFAVFKNPATGMMSFLKVQVNADGTVSFEVPFADCEFSLVNITNKKQK